MLFIYWLIYFQHARLSFCIENTNYKKNRVISSFPLDNHLHRKNHRNGLFSVCGVANTKNGWQDPVIYGSWRIPKFITNNIFIKNSMARQ